MRALVVDDEAPARRRLLRMLQRSEHIVDTAEAAGAEAALEQIRRAAPEVVFLDIRMPGMDGLALAAQCHAQMSIVFVTAHAEHAARAFDLDSVDYLLKPVRFERLTEAIQRVKLRRSTSSAPASRPIGEAAPRVVAHERGEMVLAAASEVTRFRASDKYTAFHADGRELLTEESLASLEQRLARLGFVRVHRGELVRLSAIKSLRTDDGAHSLSLVDGQVVHVSRRMASELRAKLRR